MSINENLKNTTPAIIIIPLVLTIIGLVFIFSSGINPDGSNNNQYIKQLIWIILGLILSYIIISIDYFRLVETSNYYYIAGIILLVLTLLFGKTIRGSKSWFGIGGLGIQVSEITKLFYILFYAKYLANASILERKFQTFIISLGILLLPLILILAQPDLGTSIVYVGIFFAMSYIGLNNDKYIFYLLSIGLSSVLFIFSIAFYKYYLSLGNSQIEFFEIIFNHKTLLIISLSLFLYSLITLIIDFFNPIPVIQKILPITSILAFSLLFASTAIRILKPYQWKRLLVMFSPEFDSAGAGYNIIQSKIAIGSGGIFGKGLFRGTQNILGFLPEKNTDFIFSIINEELGFFGGFLVISLFLIYFYYIIKTILNAKDKEGALVATGILSLFAIHFIVNIGMVLGVTPVTGLPLPFISYGGSSYILFISASAMIINIYSNRFIH